MSEHTLWFLSADDRLLVRFPKDRPTAERLDPWTGKWVDDPEKFAWMLTGHMDDLVQVSKEEGLAAEQRIRRRFGLFS